MKTGAVSALMLERYRLGELDPDDKQAISELLKTDDELCARMRQLDESDRELRLRYPQLPLKVDILHIRQRRFLPARTKIFMRITGLAALIIAGIMLPVLFIVRGNKPQLNKGMSVAAVPQNLQDLPADRTKGSALDNPELTVYLKGEQEIVLPDHTVLEEGNTIQLAYTVPAGSDYYGVIFSIDGRAAVTMHYPYRRGQSSLLVSGKRTFLNEAYILDDAPDYEIFIMVVSARPLDADAIIREIQGLADEAPLIIEEKSRAVFEDYEVETLTILKKQR